MKAEEVLEFGLEYNLEIVSFGLAPNPFGFCFEAHPSRETGHSAPASIQRKFSEMLESLTLAEERRLKEMIF